MEGNCLCLGDKGFEGHNQEDEKISQEQKKEGKHSKESFLNCLIDWIQVVGQSKVELS
jgi:hypothetical protein